MDLRKMTFTAAVSLEAIPNSTAFDWENLRYFAAFAKVRSLAATARWLNVEHATVSRRIGALENSLNIRLVDRRDRKYELTASGERIALLANRMEENACALSRAVCSIRTDKTTDIGLHCPPCLTSHFIAPQLGHLRNDHPDLNLRLTTEYRPGSLARREADVAILLARPTESKLVIRKIGHLDFDFFASPDYLADHDPDRYEFIGHDAYEPGSPQQRCLESAAGHRQVVLRARSLETQAMAARAGAGIALLPSFMARPADCQLRKVELDEASLQLDIWLAVHQDMRSAPGVRELMDFSISCFADQ